MDRESLLERVAGDEALADELVELFLQDVPDRLKAIQHAHETGDMKTITLEAHTIKGSSSNIGANGMREAAFQLELSGKDANQEAMPSLIKALEESFRTFQQTIADMKS